MLGAHTPVANIATADLPRSRAFYEGVLGFQVALEIPEAGAVVYQGGSGHFVLYTSEFAGTNRATSMGFEMTREDFDVELAALRDAGISFLTFEMPGLTWEDDVAATGEGRAAWFTDPDGNILSITSGSMD
jgi:catechol 2,3-dioxygenase-like lactoylglutathione lyase family enzyme